MSEGRPSKKRKIDKSIDSVENEIHEIRISIVKCLNEEFFFDNLKIKYYFVRRSRNSPNENQYESYSIEQKVKILVNLQDFERTNFTQAFSEADFKMFEDVFNKHYGSREGLTNEEVGEGMYFLFYNLGIPAFQKRRNEEKNLKGVEISGFGYFSMCNVNICRDVLICILEYMIYDHTLLFGFGSVNSNVYLTVLGSWKTITMTKKETLRRYPLLLLENVKEIEFEESSLVPFDLEVVLTKIKNVETITLTMRNPSLHFGFLKMYHNFMKKHRLKFKYSPFRNLMSIHFITTFEKKAASRKKRNNYSLYYFDENDEDERKYETSTSISSNYSKEINQILSNKRYFPRLNIIVYPPVVGMLNKVKCHELYIHKESLSVKKFDKVKKKMSWESAFYDDLSEQQFREIDIKSLRFIEFREISFEKSFFKKFLSSAPNLREIHLMGCCKQKNELNTQYSSKFRKYFRDLQDQKNILQDFADLSISNQVKTLVLDDLPFSKIELPTKLPQLSCLEITCDSVEIPLTKVLEIIEECRALIGLKIHYCYHILQNHLHTSSEFVRLVDTYVMDSESKFKFFDIEIAYGEEYDEKNQSSYWRRYHAGNRIIKTAMRFKLGILCHRNGEKTMKLGHHKYKMSKQRSSGYVYRQRRKIKAGTELDVVKKLFKKVLQKMKSDWLKRNDRHRIRRLEVFGVDIGKYWKKKKGSTKIKNKLYRKYFGEMMMEDEFLRLPSSSFSSFYGSRMGIPVRCFGRITKFRRKK